MLNDKVWKTIKREGLLSPGDTVIIGVSGGADSMALLHFLWSQENIPLNCVAAHINHGYRGAESDWDEGFVRRFCAEREIPCFVKTVDVQELAKERGVSFEECGRDIRYSFFQELAREYNAKIATAHTLSDKAETLLFNLTRGSSLKGLCSIPVKRGNIVRPLLDCSREDIEDYCKANGVEFVQDSTNFLPDYTRNKIRLEVIPRLKEINPNLEQGIRHLTESLSADADYLDELAQEAYNRALVDGDLEIAEITGLHESMRLRIIALFLKKNNIEVNFQRIQKIDGMLWQKSGKLNVGTDVFVSVGNGRIKMEKPSKPTPFFSYKLETGANIFPIGSWFVEVCAAEDYKYQKKIYKNLSIYSMDYDRISGSIILRQRLPEDRIKQPRRGTKTLKKLFNEEKIPVEERGSIPVFADNAGVFFIEGIGIDQRVQTTAETRKYMIILRGNHIDAQ